MMKKLMILLALMLLLTACGGETTTTEAPSPSADIATTEAEAPEATEPEAEAVTEPETEETEPPAASNEIVIGQPITIGDYEITVQDYSLTTDYEGKDVLKVIYDWINSGDSDTAAFMTFTWKGFQNGIEIDNAPFSDDIDHGIGQKDVRAGSSQEGVEAGFVLEDTSPVEIELEESFSFSSNKFEAVVDPSELE